ncbi:fungal zn(2)-Cys(6) binuclear cluster domain-containing protein [Hirsutella rhossiliensis]|uniref:Fungal zn(2)-Cys(6) binuclear cluster domain-containing protein n=1 Tax=Hirsutella rhossiliensis TaxID=111463 RepID=A0A9P8SFM8_9HYPO|nr:fungal zn(2)-Cys(6) binuclear cluster domain-containing protein [Hirsutella rhossiliensis]KAH0961098.1 fungal zn(2)-Cys(6) binuclear cluster domain-containing protein [Hirsutella rhossiliensis]
MERQHERRRRRRPALSCLECRRRKIKCDRNDPCAHCVSAETPCTYNVHGSESILRPQHPRRDGSGVQTASTPSAAGHSPFAYAAQQSRIGRGGLETRLRRGPSPSRAEAAAAQNDSPDRVQRLEKSSASHPVDALAEIGREVLAPWSRLQDSQVILNKTRILRWSHWFGTVFSCYAAACGHGHGTSFQGAETEALVVEMGVLLQKCKTFDLSPPAREVADSMVTLYFQSFESTYRILHKSTFWAEYERYWSHPERVSNGLRLIILLVIGIGSGLHQRGDGNVGLGTNVHQWIFSIGGDLVWMSMGSLIHSAMQIGLHRDPTHLPAMPPLQAELRRRLWATVVEMTVQSSLDSAMPPRISLDEFDVEPPSNIDDDEMDGMEPDTTFQAHPRGTYTATSMQLLLLDSLPTRLRILQLLNCLNSQLSYMDVLALSSEMTDACHACSSFMKNHEHSGVTPFHRNLLDYLVRRFLIPLHCPFASKARTNPLFHYSLKASLDTALAIISPEPDPGFSRLMAIGGGLFREGFRYASAIISLELVTQVEAQRRDGTLHRNAQYRDFLKHAMRDMIALSSERIRQGETNIKGHMFLSMLMAQVEAMEADTPCDVELQIARSARDSLEFCHDLLRTRAGTASPDSRSASPGLDGGQDSEGYGLDLDMDIFFPEMHFS